jgi:hypothetical protein
MRPIYRLSSSVLGRCVTQSSKEGGFVADHDRQTH